MDNKITIPYNDVFFYGLSLKNRDTSDVQGDIFSNIFMKYLKSLKPVSNKLYRRVDNTKFEYSYAFIPTKPLSWRVIKNRRVIEDIEYLSDGKYCLNYYDDNGNDIKRVIFSNQHKWLKTNYYNTVNASDLFCSLVPKEQNGETVLLQYITGNPYPVTLYCCPRPSNNEVLSKILNRVPEPEVMALTNYGILYFACEETFNIYKQVFTEEENKYTDANKPAVYNTQEEVENGFCFDIDSFDSTKSIESVLDLSSVDELTEDDLLDATSEVDEYIQEADEMVISETEEYSVEKEIADAIRIISEETNIAIDDEFVLSQATDDSQQAVEVASETDASERVEINLIDDIADNMIDKEEITIIDSDDIILNEEVPSFETLQPIVKDETDTVAAIISIDSDEMNLLTMDDEAIDDYVSTLIDTILKDAHSTASEYMIDNEEVFIQAETEAVAESVVSKEPDFIQENVADATIESNGASYFYYGETQDSKRSGRGKTLMSDGKTAYEGEYKNDMRHGVGSFYYKDGSLCYWGNWQDNLRNGFGIGISSETGITHVGEWNQNKPEGVGVRFDKNGKFLYVDSASHRTNGGIRVTGFTDNSMFVEIWDEKTLKVIKKEISVDDLLK